SLTMSTVRPSAAAWAASTLAFPPRMLLPRIRTEWLSLAGWACACGPARQARPSDRATPPTIVDGLLVLTTAHFLSCPPGLSDPREARSDDGLDCWMDPPLMRLTRTRASRSPPLGGRSSCPGVHVEPVLCCL